MKNYILVTPTYSKSNGVRALFSLADALIAKGYTVSLFSYAPFLDKYNYVSEITEEMKKNDIVIYPEVVRGNPLNFQNVVRYVLFYPGRLGGEAVYHHSETIFTWDKQYYKNAPELYFPFIDKKIFYNDHREKKHNSFFVYKGGQCRTIPEIENAVRIDMKYPSSREELGELLRNTETLYSYDSHSALLDEALACGAKVKIVTENDILEYTNNFEDKLSDIEGKVDQFIEITQNMNYLGDVQKPVSGFLRRLLYKYRVLVGRIFRNHKKIYRYMLRY